MWHDIDAGRDFSDAFTRHGYEGERVFRFQGDDHIIRELLCVVPDSGHDG